MSRLILHEYARSGNCYKIRLTAAHVGMALDRREYDIMKGETRTRTFLRQVSGNGRIPVLQIDDRFLPESNAACCYLADGSHLIPSDTFDRADMLHWMFWEQYNHEPYVATLRFWYGWIGEDNWTDVQHAMLPMRRAGGEAALALMDSHLTTRRFFVADRLTLADIALYPYTSTADEGGFDLSRYPAVQAWMAQVESEPGHIFATS